MTTLEELFGFNDTEEFMDMVGDCIRDLYWEHIEEDADNN